MTTCYIVEVKLDGKICYMGQGGHIGSIPKFFNAAPRVKNLLLENRTAYGNLKFSSASHKDKTTVIQIKNLELGLKGSFATLMTYDEFMARDFSASGLKIPNNPRAIYMIELAQPALQLAEKTTPSYVKLAGKGRHHKFGHQWNTGGHLRSHITSRFGRLSTTYKGAKVLEIEMNDDGFTPKQVKTYPILDFYCA
uniref:hypothetical protein n=1 Tax=Acinetobacter sp. TaxID=472 RepID=UPI00388E56EF